LVILALFQPRNCAFPDKDGPVSENQVLI